MQDRPCRGEVVVAIEQGLHARPADLLAREARKWQSRIELVADQQRADGKSILELLTLAAEAGTRLVVEATGPDAREAARGDRRPLRPQFQRTTTTIRNPDRAARAGTRARPPGRRGPQAEHDQTEHQGAATQPPGASPAGIVDRSVRPRSGHARSPRAMRPRSRRADCAPMLKLQGIAVSPGVTIGEALVLDSEGFRIPRRFVERSAVDTELERLAHAVAETAREIERNRDAIQAELGEQYAAIFDAHLAMLHDERLQEELTSAVRDKNWWPEYAVSRTLRRYAKVFQNLDNHIAQRAHDIYDIEKSLLRNLLGQRRETLAAISQPVVVLAHNLTPSETANLDRRFVKGFATELGGPGSHTAIVAEGLEIPGRGRPRAVPGRRLGRASR